MPKRAAAILALLFLAGCSTCSDWTHRTPLGPDSPHVYGGVRTFFEGGGSVEEYQRAGLGGVGMLPNELAIIFAAPLIADLCLSLVADTLLLPITLTRAAN